MTNQLRFVFWVSLFSCIFDQLLLNKVMYCTASSSTPMFSKSVAVKLEDYAVQFHHYSKNFCTIGAGSSSR